MRRYNNAILVNDMAEANVAKQDCEAMTKIISNLSPYHVPQIRLREHKRDCDGTVVNLYDHVFINGLRYPVTL